VPEKVVDRRRGEDQRIRIGVPSLSFPLTAPLDKAFCNLHDHFGDGDVHRGELDARLQNEEGFWI
jgi:hypothetical protein